MNTTEELLLAQIWERPDDRAALSVYADWLVEQGRTERGQYMQLWLMKEPTAAQWRLRDWLLAEHQQEWLGTARPFVSKWVESAASPGFFAHVTCSADNLARGFEQIVKLGPRLQVAIEPGWVGYEVMTALGKTPLGKLYRLELFDHTNHHWLTDQLLLHLGPALVGLRSLAFHPFEGVATSEAWERLLQHLGSLEQLDLGIGDPPEEWVEVLLASPLIKTLKRLSVPDWLDSEQRAQLKEAMAGRTLAFRRQNRRFPEIPPPAG
jgi:uncharacterized protein (TIGR02996 family)